VSARGVLLLGVPGTGKSVFAKALGNETGRPTLLLDVGNLYGSLVGSTEANVRQALRTLDAMAPCLCFIDELEKALGGVGGNGDSGVATRLFATLLTYLSDHGSDVFMVATSNDISKLPPEFTRAERWDGVYFIDLPTGAEKDARCVLRVERFDTNSLRCT
jgi:SpoVK/Ycf46/Vps4 family AAA+-type ATPase